MNDDAMVFAMANPEPEVMPEEAAEHVRIVATGRSDYPNQINNVLCFPGLFRGALDARATAITEEMKLAAAYGDRRGDLAVGAVRGVHHPERLRPPRRGGGRQGRRRRGAPRRHRPRDPGRRGRPPAVASTARSSPRGEHLSCAFRPCGRSPVGAGSPRSDASSTRRPPRYAVSGDAVERRVAVVVDRERARLRCRSPSSRRVSLHHAVALGGRRRRRGRSRRAASSSPRARMRRTGRATRRTHAGSRARSAARGAGAGSRPAPPR